MLYVGSCTACYLALQNYGNEISQKKIQPKYDMFDCEINDVEVESELGFANILALLSFGLFHFLKFCNATIGNTSLLLNGVVQLER